MSDLIVPKYSKPEIIIRDTFLESWEKGLYDPVYFYNYFLDRDLHDGQVAWAWGGRTKAPFAKERCWAAANRIGKSTMAGMELCRRAFYQVRDPKYNLDERTGRLMPYAAISIAMSLDQSRIAWNNALTFISESAKMRPFLGDTKDTPFPVFTLWNGRGATDRARSEVWARSTAKKARYLLGYKYNFINYDEAAWDPDAKEILDTTIRMRLIDQGGDIDLISTPNGKNWFYEQYIIGLIDTPAYKGWRFYSQTGATIENRWINRDEIVNQAERMSYEMIRQNIFGEFIEFDSVFPWEDVSRCYHGQYYKLPVLPGYKVEIVDQGEDYEPQAKLIRQEGRYVIGLDVGRKQDNTCIVVLRIDQEPVQIHEYVLVGKQVKWERIYDRVENVAHTYGNCPILLDTTGAGDPVKEELVNRGLDVHEFIFSQRSKQDLILSLVAAIQRTHIVFPYIESLVQSLTMYSFDDKRLMTDPVMALALAWKMSNDVTRYNSNFSIMENLNLVSRSHYEFGTGEKIIQQTNSSTVEVDPLSRFWDDEDPPDTEAFEKQLGEIKRVENPYGLL